MPILLDNQPLAVPHASLAGGIEAAKAAAEARGRVVIDVLLDGRRLDPDTLATPPSTPLGASELAFITTEPKAFVSGALLDAAEELDRLSGVQQKAAKAIRGGELGGAFEQLTDTVEVWDMVRRVVHEGPTLLGMDLDAARVEVDGRRGALEPHLSALTADLNELKNALALQDWSALADLLSGELDERAAQFRQLLTDLAYQIRPAGGGGGGASE